MSKKCALSTILRQAGIRPPVVQEIRAALIAGQHPGGSMDDVAGALLRWKDRHARMGYARGEVDQRVRVARAYARLNVQAMADGGDVTGQMLFESLELYPQTSDAKDVAADEMPEGWC